MKRQKKKKSQKHKRQKESTNHVNPQAPQTLHAGVFNRNIENQPPSKSPPPPRQDERPTRNTTPEDITSDETHRAEPHTVASSRIPEVSLGVRFGHFGYCYTALLLFTYLVQFLFQ